MLIYNSELRVL